MVLMGMGVAFLPALYVQSEIRGEDELRVTDLRGEQVVRVHAMAWRATSPARTLFRELAEQVRTMLRERPPAEITVVDP